MNNMRIGIQTFVYASPGTSLIPNANNRQVFRSLGILGQLLVPKPQPTCANHARTCCPTHPGQHPGGISMRNKWTRLMLCVAVAALKSVLGFAQDDTSKKSKGEGQKNNRRPTKSRGRKEHLLNSTHRR